MEKKLYRPPAAALVHAACWITRSVG